MSDDLFNRKLPGIVDEAWDLMVDGHDGRATFATDSQVDAFRRAIRKRGHAKGWKVKTLRLPAEPMHVIAYLPEWNDRNPEEAERRQAEAMQSVSYTRRKGLGLVTDDDPPG